MQFMVVYHAGPEGLPAVVPLRWQHGPTPGVTLVAAWVSNVITGSGEEGLADARTYVVIETDTVQALGAFVNWIAPFVRVEVRPVSDYMAQMKAYWSKDPEQWPVAPGQSDEQRHQMLEAFRRYTAAGSPAEALEIWRNTRVGGGKDVVDAMRIRSELDRV